MNNRVIPVIKAVLPHILAILGFLLLSALFFYPQIEGKALYQSHLVQCAGRVNEVYQVEAERGDRPLWTNSMFGGMPTYQLGAGPKGNHSVILRDALSLWISRPIGYFVLAMISGYILLVSMLITLAILLSKSRAQDSFRKFLHPLYLFLELPVIVTFENPREFTLATFQGPTVDHTLHERADIFLV